METAGIEEVNACSTCLCAGCHRGFVYPTSKHNCPTGGSDCKTCKTNLAQGLPEKPVKNCPYWSVS